MVSSDSCIQKREYHGTYTKLFTEVKALSDGRTSGKKYLCHNVVHKYLKLKETQDLKFYYSATKTLRTNGETGSKISYIVRCTHLTKVISVMWCLHESLITNILRPPLTWWLHCNAQKSPGQMGFWTVGQRLDADIK